MAGFPIFVNFGQTPPLIVGGGELAAVKARLLLKRAGSIVFATKVLSTDAGELVSQGRATVIAPYPGADQINGRPLVISATEDEHEDRRVYEIARALGVPVNVPDQPQLCTFSLPAIVDRGLVTVAIGTDGAAPVLATRLRAKLEQYLHPRLGNLAQLAAQFRERVAKVVPSGPKRRTFWDNVFGGEIGDAMLAGDEALARDRLTAAIDAIANDQDLPDHRVGRVTLVGAGPGDPDLLTLKAIRALKSADVILTDFLVGEGVLEHARREARIINVGKAPGRHTKTQAEINALIARHAHAGRSVVRLKGGDPFVFGRGGEEVESLRASGISCDVVPGITAATAAAASLQIPLTHRELARTVTFISGHAAGDGAPDFEEVDFAALGKQRATLVAYMAVATAGALAKELLDAGWSPATPVMAVERASHDSERRVATTLDVLASDTQRLNLKGPALLICGEVAGLTPNGKVEYFDAVTPSVGASREEQFDV